jgi:prolyl-tRNA synthetase
MTHSDDDGLVLPPKLAPAQIVILPIYRDDAQRRDVLDYVESLRQELTAQSFGGAAVRVEVDDRDVRGGEKKWHHVKRGVPIRLEVGPKDIEKNSVFMGRRDQPKSVAISRDELVGSISNLLQQMQQSLFDRALQLRHDHTVSLNSEAEFRDFFTAPDENQIHGGFAHCHFSDEDAIEPLLKELKVTVRCIPRENNEEAGTCFFTGKPSAKKAIFAKAY